MPATARTFVQPGPHDQAWENGIKALVAYAHETGNATPDAGYKTDDGFTLGQWVSRQRTSHRSRKLSMAKVKRLDAIPGWVWDIAAHKWEQGFWALLEHVVRGGDLWMPTTYVTDDDFPLGSWVARQRKLYGDGTLSPDRSDRLEMILGWVWEGNSEYLRGFGLAGGQQRKFAEEIEFGTVCEFMSGIAALYPHTSLFDPWFGLGNLALILQLHLSRKDLSKIETDVNEAKALMEEAHSNAGEI